MLRSLAKAVRSKNAGPFMITLDVFFGDEDTYSRVKDSGTITKETIANLYKIPIKEVYGVYFIDETLSIKASLYKPHPPGDPECTSVMGSEFHIPLADLDTP
jgi:hypothetical protein